MRNDVFQYEYMTSEDVLQETSLPSKDKFYCTSTSSHISDDEDRFAKGFSETGNAQNSWNI